MTEGGIRLKLRIEHVQVLKMEKLCTEHIQVLKMEARNTDNIQNYILISKIAFTKRLFHMCGMHFKLYLGNWMAFALNTTLVGLAKCVCQPPLVSN